MDSRAIKQFRRPISPHPLPRFFRTRFTSWKSTLRAPVEIPPTRAWDRFRRLPIRRPRAAPTAIGTNQITANWTANGNPAGTLVLGSSQPGFRILVNYLSRSHDEQLGRLERPFGANDLFHARSGFQPSWNSDSLYPFASGHDINHSAQCSRRRGLYRHRHQPDHRQLDGQRQSRRDLLQRYSLDGGFAQHQRYRRQSRPITTTNLSAPFTALSPNTLYYVDVNAASSGGNSAYTSLGSVPTLAAPPAPGNPTNIGTNQITANWGSNGNPAGTLYTVQASTDSGFSSIISAVTDDQFVSRLVRPLTANGLFHARSGFQSSAELKPPSSFCRKPPP